MKFWYLIVAIFFLVIWLGPYVLGVIAIYVIASLWKMTKSASKSDVDNVISNHLEPKSIFDEQSSLSYIISENQSEKNEIFEKSKFQGEKIKSVTDALITMDAHLGYKMTKRMLSFVINYWNQWKGVQSTDLYDFVIEAAQERCRCAKRDFVKKECRQIVQIIELLKKEVPADDIIRIVFSMEKIKTTEIGNETDASILQGNVHELQQVANCYSRNDRFENDTLLVPIGISENVVSVVIQVVSGLTTPLLRIVNGLMINAVHREKEHEIVEYHHSLSNVVIEDETISVIQVVSGLKTPLLQIVNGLMINAAHREQEYELEKNHSSFSNAVPEDMTISMMQIVSGLSASLPSILNGIMTNAINREKISGQESVPYWKDTYVNSTNELQSANNQQKRFYSYFKSQFLKGFYLDIFENSNYAFVLMFDLADDYFEHRDYAKLKRQLHTLAEHYPVVERYIEMTIIKVVIEKERTDAKRILCSYDKSQGQLCRWITPCETIKVQGITLTRGNFYLGECFLLPKKIRDKDYYLWEEKLAYIYGSVLNPDLPANNKDQLDKAFYSYNDMSPAWRYEYLMWLSGKKSACDVPTDILLFYLYGCEIRMFVDSETKMSERETILSDIINLYESLNFENVRDNEFPLRDRLSDFIVYTICNYFRTKIVDHHIKCLLKNNSTYQSYYIEYRLHCNKNISIDDIFNIATDIFEIQKLVPINYISIARQIFSEDFLESYGNININFKTTCKQNNRYIRYNDYNNYFNPDIENLSLLCHEVDALPDGFWEIREAIRSCCWNLRSKFLKYNQVKEKCGGKETIAALFLLPENVNVFALQKIRLLRFKIENEMQSGMFLVKPIEWLLELWEYERKNDKSIHLVYADSIIGGLSRMGLDIVPDYQLDRKRFNFGGICVIYRNEKHFHVMQTTKYEQSVLFINLATQIVHADQVYDSDYAFIEQQLKAYNQTNGNYLHLLAYVRWKFLSKKQPIDKQSLTIIKTLKSDECAIMANALIMFAFTNGGIHPKRIDSLKKVLSLLGQETSDIHARIHRMIINSEGFALVEKKTDAVEFSIKREKWSSQHSGVPSVVIDSKKLQVLEQQTEAAHAILSEIFIDEVVEKPINKVPNKTSKVWMSILELLFTKEIWERSEIEGICKSHGLMLGAVLEQINDFAYEIIDDAVIEDDGSHIYVTMDYKNELI